MKKTVLLAGLLAIPIALADGKWGCKSGEGVHGVMSSLGIWGYWIMKLIFIALGAFIFSVVFWQTYKWLVKNNKITRKKPARKKKR